MIDDHGSNRHHPDVEANVFDVIHLQPDYKAMSLKQLQTIVDSEILVDTVDDIMSLPVEKRTAAIEAFAEIDPVLGTKLHLAVSFALS